MPEFDIQNPIISVDELQQNLGSASLLLFDCRFQLGAPNEGHREYLASRIPGAQYLHLDEDLSGPLGDGSMGRHPLPRMAAFWDRMVTKGVSVSSNVICYDSSGGAYASRAWWLLKWCGFDTVWVLDGGWQAWQKSDFDIETGPAVNASDSRPYTESAPPNPRPDWRKVVEEFQSDLGGANLIDSRTNDRYQGLNETIDPIAGHIPFATNLAWVDNVTDEGTFKPVIQLQERFKSAFEEEVPPTFYCGSGVTACHNILATQIAGYPMPLLYAESWSGWISDSNRPIET